MGHLNYCIKELDKEKELPMSVDDIMHIDERGRWWLVGSAWFPTASVPVNKTDEKFIGQTLKFSASLLQLAKRAKMNTAIRRDIFCTIMSSTVNLQSFLSYIDFIYHLIKFLLPSRFAYVQP